MIRIEGLVAAPFTAFQGNGAIDPGRIPEQKEYYIRNGISGVFVCGTTGEGSALTLAEKKTLFSAWGEAKSPGFHVIGFIGGTSVAEARELALHARDCGLDAVAMTAPYYQRAASVHDLALTLAEAASAVPDLPFFYYHIPSLTGVCIPMIDLLAQMDASIPNLAGIKYTFENLMDYQMCLEFKDRKYNIMWGRDEMLLPALSVGATSFVGSTYGYMAPIYTEMVDAFRKGCLRRAASLQYAANRMIALLGKYGNGTGKAFMKAAGMDLGPCRRPLTTLSEDQYRFFLRDLDDTAFGQYKCKIP